ncbi:hypothetical protein [Glycomyces niveus]|uniref:Ribbon-helix-helix protein CopG domain-containing protein n=1 Tax=Glycomyces niveus TaxID=2820287 RepID=A0ABS3U3I3_9ACTN|nr:hypothetical protein [Glycomyces sp. NEAU-S30]MBO3733339.1 hypothetical protein [Glycomyces sp. NEAU-S30]
MTKPLIELSDDLARWLARDAARLRASRQNLVLDLLRRDYERSLEFEATLDRILQENSELLRRLGEGPPDSQDRSN